MNKIIDKMIDYMFDSGMVYITERKDGKKILTPTSVIILTNGEVLETSLPTNFTGKEKFQIFTKMLKEAGKGRLIMPDGRKNKKEKGGRPDIKIPTFREGPGIQDAEHAAQ